MGTSLPDMNINVVNQDHPHAYGDKFSLPLPKWYFWGSSPRVWGQEVFRISLDSFVRIIPTRMGTSCKARTLDGNSQDHPHAYGDKKSGLRKGKYGMGSSPRVWGQATLTAYTAILLRIIPTRMGTRYERWGCGLIRQDHPHAYGDKNQERVADESRRGSSPRVWGQGIGRSRFSSVFRIIPTRMGTSA